MDLTPTRSGHGASGRSSLRGRMRRSPSRPPPAASPPPGGSRASPARARSATPRGPSGGGGGGDTGGASPQGRARYLVPMSKTASREQRARAQGAWAGALFDPQVPYHGGAPPPLHMPEVRMAAASARRPLHSGPTTGPGPASYDADYRQVEASTVVRGFDGYASRAAVARALAHGRHPRALEVPLQPDTAVTRRRVPTLDFARQVDATAYRRLARSCRPLAAIPYKDEVVLRPKYAALDRRVSHGVTFAKTLGRDQAPVPALTRRPEAPPPEGATAATVEESPRPAPKVKGYVTMATQASRYDRPASRFAVLGETENVKRTMYYSPEDKFSLNQFVMQEQEFHRGDSRTSIVA